MGKINNIEFYMQKTLPSVFDDSLSYYEVLTKLIGVVNELIDSNNLTYDDLQSFKVEIKKLLSDEHRFTVSEISRLEIRINQLNSDVLNYFDNLDITDEINDKLDEMLLDGSLAEVINVQIFTEMYDMISLNRSKLVSHYNEGLNGVTSLNLRATSSEQALVTFIDDDGYKTVYTRLRPIFNSKQVPFVAAVSGSLIDQPTYMSEDDVKRLHSEGHEIINHNYSHTVYTPQTANQWEVDIRANMYWLYERGFSHDVYVNPQSEGDLRIDIMERYAKCAFNRIGFNDGSTLKTYNLERQPYGSWIPGLGNYEGAPLSYYTDLVDRCIANKSWLTFMIHVNVQSATQDSILSMLIDYIKAAGVKIVTASEGFNLKANRLESGGKVVIDRFGDLQDTFKVERTHSRKNSDPVTAYPDGKITMSPMSWAYVTTEFGFDFGSNAGMLLTYRKGGNDNGYYKQRFEVYQKSVTYIRSWNHGSNSWTLWEIENANIVMDVKNARVSSSPPNAYPGGKLIYTEMDFNHMQTAGFPVTDAGCLLITDAFVMGFQSGHVKQTLRKINSNSEWGRCATSPTTWTNWVVNQ